MSTLWAPLEVADFDRSNAFYGDLLKLQTADWWQRDGERGAVFAAGHGGWIEIVQTNPPTEPAGIALELDDWDEVDRFHQRVGEAAEDVPKVFPRGHYGFVVVDPDGNRLLLWSERKESEQ
jgi:predicted enzyme related to lactoylglutathione lyase